MLSLSVLYSEIPLHTCMPTCVGRCTERYIIGKTLSKLLTNNCSTSLARKLLAVYILLIDIMHVFQAICHVNNIIMYVCTYRTLYVTGCLKDTISITIFNKITDRFPKFYAKLLDLCVITWQPVWVFW